MTVFIICRIDLAQGFMYCFLGSVTSCCCLLFFKFYRSDSNQSGSGVKQNQKYVSAQFIYDYDMNKGGDYISTYSSSFILEEIRNSENISLHCTSK